MTSRSIDSSKSRSPGTKSGPTISSCAAATTYPKKNWSISRPASGPASTPSGTVYHEAALNGEQLRYEWMVDAVDTTAEAFLGLTVRCTRCHDHKFDPISQVDYHRMMAVFAGSEIKRVPVVNKMSEFGYYSGFPNQLQVFEYQEAVRRLDAKVRQRLIGEIVAKFPPDVVAAFKVPKKERSIEQEKIVVPLTRAITEAGLRENAAGYAAELPYTPDERDHRATLITELGKAAAKANFVLKSAPVRGHADVLYPVHMTSRGDWRSKGELVIAGRSEDSQPRPRD